MTIKICQAGFGLLTALLLAKWFGADIFGVYAYSIAMATLIAVFSRFGFHVYVVYAINYAITEGRKYEVGSILTSAWSTAFTLSLISGACLWTVTLLAPEWQMSNGLKYGAFLIGAVAIMQVSAGAVQAFGRVQLGLALEGVGKPLLFLLWTVASLRFYTPEEIGYEGLLVGYIVSELILILASCSLLFFWTRNEMGGFKLQKSLIFKHMCSSRAYLMANAMIQLYQQAGMVAVGIAFAPAQAALYRVASQTASLIPFGLQALQAVMRPKIARMYTKSDDSRRELQRLMTWSTRLLALVQCPVMVATIFFSTAIMALFGTEFQSAGPMLTALAIGQSYSILCGMNGDALNMTGRADITARWSIIALVLVLSLIGPLMYLCGSLGVAWAVSISRIVWNTGLEYSAVKHTGLHTTFLGVIHR